MDKPIIASKKPTVSVLEPGTYYWCSCGKSQNQPYCDGSHKGTNFTPLKFEITEQRRAALCNCKYTENGPFCDGKHTRL
ncbi:CDGSH iron-sulfur domain-containing protein [Candidatus Uabimicrobium amorphum]|uniref:Glutamate synthase n=1 Tax=Uabimicrobium amorphum TaxID=2596890 RepID=A0A5S9F811_UABAM|nr:CDGSH iron-sulfur domain-containing protein [Candidatus Uabimicrobium amorphum]BBM87822.1 glutamate synthase [Candidatus Uabimicrobium amorphum]